MVTQQSQPSGTNVTQVYRHFSILIRIVVQTHSATVASNWFEIPKSGQRLLIPPNGSVTPWYKKYPHAATISALERMMLGYQPVRPNGFQKWPKTSCNMKRPTRVPASIIVRMNKASNMMAKWYQMAIT